jgi:allophanate hydrolase subunit 1/biotin carboxyl carrier protein
MHGPHDSDDIMTSEDREMLYTTKWRVGHNSNRTGIRLEGPKPKWARSNGGEGGSHPSNILDYGYPSPGGLNWTGDDPVAFTMDSPNLGGLICSTTVVSADLWRLGQLKPGDHTCMRPISYAQARELAGRVESYIEDLAKMISGATNDKPILDLALAEGEAGPAILKRVPPEAGRPALTYRQGGDCFILLELGEQQIDILITVRIRLITSKLMEMKIPGVIVVPNVTSLLVQYDPKLISQGKLLDILSGIYSSVELTKSTKITTREFHLPAVLDHPVLQEGIAQYMATTRPTAAYLPDNVEYLRRNNGLATRREAFGRCIDTPFLIVAVGFLCGAPELLPLNPMNQLRAQKYNPSRTYTPGGAIGMGGSLFSMYPVEQPGGYMLVGRTVEGWDTYGTKPGFTADKPWMYEPFDLVYFHEVSLEDYDKIHRDYFAGKFQYDVREGLFDVDAVVASMEASKQDPAYIAFKEGQRKGVEEQLALETRLYAEWKAQKEAEAAEEAIRLKELVSEALDPSLQVTSPMDANVWKVLVAEGDTLKKGQVLVILEAMKMEINVCAPEALDGAVVKAVATKPGHTVAPGSMLVVGTK